MAIPYVKQTWTDGSGGGTPVSAARLGVVEQGVFDAHYQPAVRVFHNAAQALTTATFTALAFNSEHIDQSGNAADTMHDTVTNNSRLTCRYAGVYQISGTVEFAANATGIRILRIRHSTGPTYISSMAITNAGGADPTAITVSTLYPLAVNDYVELVAYQASGGNLNVTFNGNYTPYFMMARVG